MIPSKKPRTERCTRLRAKGGREAGLTLAEIIVAAALALIGFLIALVLYQAARQAFKRGELAADQQQEIRVAYDRMVRDLRLAGYNWNATGEDRPGEEQIEGAWGGAITVRADFDFEDPTLSRDPERLIAGSTNANTVGNDEIVTFCLRKPDGSGGTSITFSADVNSSTTATSPLGYPVAVRDGVVETITIPNVHLPDAQGVYNNPPYNLVRVALSNRRADFGTAQFLDYQVLAENVRSLTFTYKDASGTSLFPTAFPQGVDTAAAKADRAKIRRVGVRVVGMTSVADFNYVDPTETVASARNFRKFDLASEVTPRNLGFKGRADVDLTPPSVPTGLALCPGHCEAMLVIWNANPPADGVATYTLRYGTSAANQTNLIETNTNSHYIQGLTAGTTYYFSVRAVDASRNASSYTTTVSGVVSDATYPVRTVPSAPTFATFTGTGHASPAVAAVSNRIDLGWDAVTTNEQNLTCDPSMNLLRDHRGYRLHRSTTAPFAPGAGNQIADESILTPATTSYSDSSVVNCRTYYYHMRASDLASCNNLSTTWASAYDARAVTSIPPDAPTGVVTTRTGTTQCTASWSAVTRDTATPVPNPIIIDKYNVWRTRIPTGQDPETATYIPVSSVQGVLTWVDNTCPADQPGFIVYYKVSALDDCPNESARSSAAAVDCPFNGTVGMTPVSSGPNLPVAPITVTVTASGSGGPFVSARLVITKSGGATDLDQTQVVTATSWSFNWTPGQGPGVYTGTATVTNAASCTGSRTNTWTVAISSCSLCAGVVPNNPPDPPSSSSPYFYRQANTINNVCFFPLEITSLVIRETNPSACSHNKCFSPIKLLRIQYRQSGSFASESSDVVWNSPVAGGSNISATSSVTANFPNADSPTTLALAGNSSTARIRLIFETSNEGTIWVTSNPNNQQRHNLLADITFGQTSGLCEPGAITNQRLNH